MYGKLIDGEFYGAPDKLNGDGVTVWNPPAEMYILQGWKPVVFTDFPDATPIGYHYENEWTEDNDKIMQVWVLVESPDEIDELEAYDIIFGGTE